MEEEEEPSKIGHKYQNRNPQVPQIKIIRKLEGHEDYVKDFCVVPFFDGTKRIISCGEDRSIRIWNLSNGNCEEVQKHSDFLYSILFVERTSQIFTTSRSSLSIWNLNRSKNETITRIQKKKEVKVSSTINTLYKIIQLSSLSRSFVSCSEEGEVYRINFSDFDEKEVKLNSVDVLYSEKKKETEPLRCVYQLLTQKDFIVFAGGVNGGKDFSIKKLNWRENISEVVEFEMKHTALVYCISSFVSQMKNEEIVVSGDDDERIIFWSLNGRFRREVKCDWTVRCFLFDREFDYLFFAGDQGNVYSFDLEDEKILGEIEIHGYSHINSLDWLDEEQTIFVSCSDDNTLSIQKIENKRDLKLGKMTSKIVELRKYRMNLMKESLFGMKKILGLLPSPETIINLVKKILQIKKRKIKIILSIPNTKRFNSTEFSQFQKKISSIEDYKKVLKDFFPFELHYESLGLPQIKSIQLNNKIIYFGEAKEGKPNGEGVLFKGRGIIRTYGVIFKGHFDEMGRKHKKGIELDLKTGYTIYEGQYKDDLRHGRGAEYDLKNFEVRHGIWEKGKLVETMSRYEYGTISFTEIEKQFIPKNEIGRGANGSVYSVLWRGKERAAKLASFSLSEHGIFTMVRLVVKKSLGLVASMSQECNNIVKIIGYIEGDRKVGYLMEKCVCDVTSVITRGKIPFKKKIGILLDVANGMEYLHSKEIMNRDLKPGNCLIREDGSVVLTDLDTAKEDESLWKNNVVNTASSIGTPVFLAPELMSKKYDKRIDVFSFGIMIYCVMFQTVHPYSETPECPRCNTKTSTMNSYAFPTHVRDCGLRPLIDHQKQKSLKEDETFVIDLMRSCWATNPVQRPSFEEISFLLNRKMNEFDDRILRISVKGSKNVLQQERIILMKKTVSALRKKISVRWPNSKIVSLSMLNHPSGRVEMEEENSEFDLKLENFVVEVEDPVILVEFEEIPMEEDLLTMEELFERFKKEKLEKENALEEVERLKEVIRKMKEK